MNFLVKIPAGEKGEGVKTPMRFTDSKNLRYKYNALRAAV
jgi:hypothetical protein